jgi:hypothetical protein
MITKVCINHWMGKKSGKKSGPMRRKIVHLFENRKSQCTKIESRLHLGWEFNTQNNQIGSGVNKVKGEMLVIDLNSKGSHSMNVKCWSVGILFLLLRWWTNWEQGRGILPECSVSKVWNVGWTNQMKKWKESVTSHYIENTTPSSYCVRSKTYSRSWRIGQLQQFHKFTKPVRSVWSRYSGSRRSVGTMDTMTQTSES